MSRTLSITISDEDADRLDSLALIRDKRRTKLAAEFVHSRLARLAGRERECVEWLVQARREADAHRAAVSNVVPLRRVSQ